MAAATTEYKYVGMYAHTLNSGRPVEPGEVVKLTKEEVADNEELMDLDLLMELKKGGDK